MLQANTVFLACIRRLTRLKSAFNSPCELAILADTGRCLVLFRATEAPYAETAVSALACRSVSVEPVLLRSSMDFISLSVLGFVLTKHVKKETVALERVFEGTSADKILRRKWIYFSSGLQVTNNCRSPYLPPGVPVSFFSSKQYSVVRHFGSALL